ncbi:MAG: GYF domain-containing protein [Bacteroidales bacterium]|nr:GYF domain-containing protein [Bacteroidales bacterium]
MYHFFYFANNQSYGPYSKEQILDLNLPDDTQIWDNRTKDWKELKYVFGTNLVSENTDIKLDMSEMDWFRYVNIGKTSNYIEKKIRNYKISFWFMSVFLVLQIGVIGYTYQRFSYYYPIFDIENFLSMIGIMGSSFILRFGFLISGLIFLINLCEIIYYSWRISEPNRDNVSGLKVIGFLFIPFYNIYWVFYVFSNLPKFLLSKAQQWGLSNSASISESLVITTSIVAMLSLIPFINFFVFVPFLVLSYIYILKIADYTHLLYRQIEMSKKKSYI